MKTKFFTIFALSVALFLNACGGKSDADLQKAATEKLSADKVAGVVVAVKDGVATLTGEVADITVKNKAAAAVKGVEGVKSVDDKTTLKPLPPPPSPAGGDGPQSDAMMKGTIDEALKKMGISGVTVAVKDGEATLSGTIPKDRLAEATKAAMEADVKKVNNKLTLK
jgi:hyperosmotically inducible periplasmic protein